MAPRRGRARATRFAVRRRAPTTASIASRSASVGSASSRRRSSYTASTRIAVALNSAVPDFGSVASIVSTFVATSSGKWRFMNASPGRSVVVVAHGRLDRAAPRDDAHALAVGDAVALAVLGREQDRLAADVERRRVAAGLHAGVERLEPPPGRQAQREVVVEQVDRRSSARPAGTARGSSTTSSHSRPWRKTARRDRSRPQHGHWMPPSSSSRA